MFYNSLFPIFEKYTMMNVNYKFVNIQQRYGTPSQSRVTVVLTYALNYIFYYTPLFTQHSPTITLIIIFFSF